MYAQIQSLDHKQDVLDMIDTQLGGDRGKNYWNRRKMWDCGLTVTCGTDLPLLLPNIPEAIYCGVGGHFADGGTYNEQNMLTVPEMLTAWTKNSQYNCYNEDRLGTLEAGKLADIAVLDGDVFHAERAGEGREGGAYHFGWAHCIQRTVRNRAVPRPAPHNHHITIY